MTFTDDQIAELDGQLHREHVARREQAGLTLDYIEAWHAIAECNRIFGFDGWDRETVYTNETAESEREIGRQKKPGWEVGYVAKVRVTVRPKDGPAITREGTGSGTGIAVSRADAHESAVKEAESDAMKRALMTFGNKFGLCLYDKKKRGLTDSASAMRKDDGGAAWTQFLTKLSSITDPDECQAWYETPDTQKRIEKWPAKWRQSAEEEYDRHIQSLYGTKKAAE